MAKPLNLAEHKAAFSKFLLFFFLTVALVSMALYFNFKIPTTELSILRERSELLRNQNIAQENYKRTLMDLIESAKRIDSLGNSMGQGVIQPKIDKLRNIPNLGDSLSSPIINDVILNLANNYINAKYDLYKVKNSQEKINEADKKIAQLNTDLNNTAALLQACRTGSGGNYAPPPVAPQQPIPNNPPR